MVKFLELSNNLNIDYSIVPTVGGYARDTNINEKAATYLLATCVQHGVIGDTRVDVQALNHYFSNLDFKFFHRTSKSPSYLNSVAISDSLSTLMSKFLNKDLSTNWVSSNGYNRKNLANAKLFTLELLYSELDSGSSLPNALKNMEIDPTEELINKLYNPDFFQSFSRDTYHAKTSDSEKLSETISGIDKSCILLQQKLYPDTYKKALEHLNAGKTNKAIRSLFAAIEASNCQPALTKLIELASVEPIEESSGPALAALMDLYDEGENNSKEVSIAIFEIITKKSPEDAQEYLDKAIEQGYQPENNNIEITSPIENNWFKKIFR